ncbi:MAG: PIN domain-containing protein [Gammaproteobacteria bacterium]|nr:PIN domain-containing protein [Gammaproteobacteria bacterium]
MGPAGVNRPFIDSNVILYLLSADSTKADRAEALLSERGIISVQVLNEIVSVCLRKLKMPWEEIDDILVAVKAACDVVPITLQTHATAIDMTKRYQLSFYDALICAAAVLAGVTLILSEDIQTGMELYGLTIKNPFR